LLCFLSYLPTTIFIRIYECNSTFKMYSLLLSNISKIYYYCFERRLNSNILSIYFYKRRGNSTSLCFLILLKRRLNSNIFSIYFYKRRKNSTSRCFLIDVGTEISSRVSARVDSISCLFIIHPKNIYFFETTSILR
jgi:hypothetical protein